MEEKAINNELLELHLQPEQRRRADFFGINQFGNRPALIVSDVLLAEGSFLPRTTAARSSRPHSMH